PLLAILVEEIDCSDLEILSTTGDTVTCLGKLTLTATASGSGSGIYWFDAASGGNIVGRGPVFQTDELSSTTSFWATEVHLDSGGGYASGYGLPAPISGANFGSAAGSYGLL